MRNPFDIVEQPPAPKRRSIEYTGMSLACQENGCWQVVGDGIYYPADELLTWVCPQGHESEVKIKI